MKAFDSLLAKKWIFVGGKGGVGKTSTSCSLALSISSLGQKVLLISTDPAHNLSDAFGQKFGHEIQKVKGHENLSVIEIDPSKAVSKLFDKSSTTQFFSPTLSSTQTSGSPKKGLLKKIISSFPGIDEAVTFHVLITDKTLSSFDKIIFDTAPTGHTLKFLGLPSTLDTALKELLSLKESLSPVLSSLRMLGQFTEQNEGTDEGGLNSAILSLADDDIFNKLSYVKNAIEEIKQIFTNKEKATFVCVSIPEMMSLYETERLIKGIKEHNISCEMIIINQIIKGGSCKTCSMRSKIHNSFIEQFEVLYEDDFKLVKVPVMDFEIRGAEALSKMGEYIKKYEENE